MRTALHQRLLHTFGDGRLEQLHGRSDVVVVRADAGEDDQRTGTLDPCRQLRDRVVEQHPRPAGVAGLEVIAGRVDGRPSASAVESAGVSRCASSSSSAASSGAPRALARRAASSSAAATSASGPSAASAT